MVQSSPLGFAADDVNLLDSPNKSEVRIRACATGINAQNSREASLGHADGAAIGVDRS